MSADQRRSVLVGRSALSGGDSRILLCNKRGMADSLTPTEFDPLAVENIGVTLAVELLEQPLLPMPPPTPFAGAGVYALYYGGDHPTYRSLVDLDGGRFKWARHSEEGHR